MMEEYSKSKKKKHKLENQKLMMKISSNKNVSGIGCVILLGGALITAAAMGSAFLISRKNKKSNNNITKKEENEKIEDESSNKGLHFLLAEQQQSSSNGTDKLCHNDSTISLFSTPCLIQDGKPKLDEKRDTLYDIVSDHPKEEGKSPSFERLPQELELSETKISLLPDPDQELDEVSRVRVEVIQGNEKIEVLSRVDQAQTTIFSNPALQMDNEREFLVQNDEGESNELQHTGVIEMDNLEEGTIQEQEKLATGDQEASTSNEHEPVDSVFELMKAGDEDEDEDHLQCVYFEEQCVDAETQIDQNAKKCDEANSCYVQATSENSHCGYDSMDAQNLVVFEIRNASVDEKHSAEVIQVIKETQVMDPAASEEQSLESEQLVEKQSFETDCQGSASKENEVEEIVFVNEEAEEEDHDYDEDIDKEDAAQEVEARNSSEQSNGDEIWPAESNQELLLKHKEENVKEEEEGSKIEEDELCSVENCNLKSTQNDVAITSGQQSYDGKDDSTVNVIDSYRKKLMYLNDIAAITRGRRVLLGVLLVLIWYFILKAFLLPL